MLTTVQGIEDLTYYFESGASGEIVKTQTTYLDLNCLALTEPLPPHQFRIHFHGKREFALGLGKFTSMRLLETHPLLLEYSEPIVAVQLVSYVANRQLFLAELEVAATKVFDGWRSREHYNFIPLDRFLEASFGILMEAPKSYAEEVVRAGERSDVKLIILD